MVSTTSQINKFIEFIVVLGDLIILNLVLSFLLFFWEEAFVSLPFSCRVSWMMTSLSLCYLACSGSRGRGVIDSLFLLDNVDIYVTGSNAYLLSGEIATLLTGRYAEPRRSFCSQHPTQW